jgi:hypothetical protein
MRRGADGIPNKDPSGAISDQACLLSSIDLGGQASRRWFRKMQFCG